MEMRAQGATIFLASGKWFEHIVGVNKMVDITRWRRYGERIVFGRFESDETPDEEGVVPQQVEEPLKLSINLPVGAEVNPLFTGPTDKATATELNIDPNLLLKAARAIKLLKESFPARIMLIGRDEVLRGD